MHVEWICYKKKKKHVLRNIKMKIMEVLKVLHPVQKNMLPSILFPSFY